MFFSVKFNLNVCNMMWFANQCPTIIKLCTRETHLHLKRKKDIKDYMEKTFYSILLCELINNTYFLYDSVVCETLTKTCDYIITGVQHEGMFEGQMLRLKASIRLDLHLLQFVKLGKITCFCFLFVCLFMDSNYLLPFWN